MLAKLQLIRCKFSAAKKIFPTFRGRGVEPVNPPLNTALVARAFFLDIIAWALHNGASKSFTMEIVCTTAIKTEQHVTC